MRTHIHVYVDRERAQLDTALEARSRVDWERLAQGLPQEDAHVGVLREGMAIDTHERPGVYFGTSTGQLFASADEGESWTEIASYLPGITSVEVAVLA